MEILIDKQRANDIKHRLRQQKKTVKSWCAEHNFKYQTASDVLRGIRKGNFGEGREVAEKLIQI